MDFRLYQWVAIMQLLQDQIMMVLSLQAGTSQKQQIQFLMWKHFYGQKKGVTKLLELFPEDYGVELMMLVRMAKLLLESVTQALDLSMPLCGQRATDS